MVRWSGGEIIIPSGGGERGWGGGRSNRKMSLCPVAGKWSSTALLLDA